MVGEPCLSCVADSPPQRATLAWGEHSGVLRHALLALKHRARDDLAAPLGSLLAARVAVQEWCPKITVVTAVPSHPWFRLRRGWTAASMLAQVVAKSIGVPFKQLLRRRRLGRQTGLSRAQRLRLPAAVFTPRSRLSGGRALVIDDVTTTGTTLRRAATAILDAGATTVYCATLAHSPDSRRLS
jgi:predicted amidophosphoribosyltransferase